MLSRVFTRFAPRVLVRHQSTAASRDVGALVAAAPEAVVRVSPSESAQTAAQKLLESDLGALVVVEEERVRGVVSDADFTKLIGLGGAEGRTVADIMTRDIISCPPNVPPAEAKRLLVEHGIRHLPVIKGERLVGLLSLSQIAKEERIVEGEAAWGDDKALLGEHDAEVFADDYSFSLAFNDDTADRVRERLREALFEREAEAEAEVGKKKSD